MTAIISHKPLTSDSPAPICPSWCTDHEEDGVGLKPGQAAEHQHRGYHHVTLPGCRVTVDLLQIARSYEPDGVTCLERNDDPHVVVYVTRDDGTTSDYQAHLSEFVAIAAAISATLPGVTR